MENYVVFSSEAAAVSLVRGSEFLKCEFFEVTRRALRDTVM